MALPIEDFINKPFFAYVSDLASELGVSAYVFGGAVRDCYLCRAYSNIDIVLSGDPIEFSGRIARKLGVKASYFKNSRIAKLHFKGDDISFYSFNGKNSTPGIHEELTEDELLYTFLCERDLTINAIAISLSKEDYGGLVDPLRGIVDLYDGIIRTPMVPDHAFSIDPIRMLRAIRFVAELSWSALPFRISSESLDSIIRHATRVKVIPRERVAEELNKMLVTSYPSRAIDLMMRTGLLKIILPWVYRLKGVKTINGLGYKDNFLRTLEVLNNVAREEEDAIKKGTISDCSSHTDKDCQFTPRTKPYLWLRWAALLLNIGKEDSKRFDPKTGWRFDGHEVIAGKMVPQVFKELKLPLGDNMKYVQKLIALQKRPNSLAEPGTTDSAYRRLLFDVGNDAEDLMLLCRANVTSRKPELVQKTQAELLRIQKHLMQVEQEDALRNFKVPITGKYIMQVYGIEPGLVISQIKEQIKEAILDGQIPNTFEAADAYMRRIAPTLGLKDKEDVPDSVVLQEASEGHAASKAIDATPSLAQDPENLTKFGVDDEISIQSEEDTDNPQQNSTSIGSGLPF